MSAVTEALIWIIRNLGLVAGVFMFFVGLAFIPLLAMALPGTLPAFIAEPLANNLWKVSGMAQGRMVLHQTATDEYEIRGTDDDREPANHWSRVVGIPFGISYDRCEEAFRERVEHLDPTAIVTDGGDSLPGKRVEMDVTRGGVGTYIDTSEVDTPGLFVRMGEKVAELKDTDGLDTVNVAEDETLKTDAGDTAMESKWKVILWLGMAFFGALAGVGVFFVF